MTTIYIYSAIIIIISSLSLSYILIVTIIIDHYHYHHFILLMVTKYAAVYSLSSSLLTRTIYFSCRNFHSNLTDLMTFFIFFRSKRRNSLRTSSFPLGSIRRSTSCRKYALMMMMMMITIIGR